MLEVGRGAQERLPRRRNALEKLVSAFVSSWNAHDAHAFAAVFAEDVDFTNVFGLVSDGRAAVERSHAAIFRTIFKDSVLTTQVRLR